MEQKTWLNDLTTTNDEVFKRACQYIDSLTVANKTLQSSLKTTKKIIYLRDLATLVRNKRNYFFQNIAEKNSSFNMQVHHVLLNKNKR